MKILFIISNLKNGGAERVCALIASRFSKDHDVCVLKFDNEKSFYELDKKIKIIDYKMPTYNFFSNLKKRFSKLFFLRKILKENKFDATICFLTANNLLAIISSLGIKNKIIISEHTSYKRPIKIIFKILKFIFYPLASYLVVLSKDDEVNYKKINKNTKIIYNPIFLKKSKIDTKENLIIFVGRLTKIKNCEMFLRIAKKLPSYNFAVIGDGELMQDLQKQASQNIIFFGSVTNIEDYYSRSKIIISTSYFEGLPNVLIESINYNCLRLSSNTSGAKELIDNEFDGYLFDFDDEKVIQIVNKLMQDENLRMQICQNAKQRLFEFDLENIYQKWISLI